MGDTSATKRLGDFPPHFHKELGIGFISALNLNCESCSLICCALCFYAFMFLKNAEIFPKLPVLSKAILFALKVGFTLEVSQS